MSSENLLMCSLFARTIARNLSKDNKQIVIGSKITHKTFQKPECQNKKNATKKKKDFDNRKILRIEFVISKEDFLRFISMRLQQKKHHF